MATREIHSLEGEHMPSLQMDMLGRVRRFSRRAHPDVIRLEETEAAQTFHLHVPAAIATQSSAKETEIVTCTLQHTQTHDF